MPSPKTVNQKLKIREILQKQLDENAGKATASVAAAIAGRSPAVRSHFFRSPSAIHPKHLVIYHVFRTDADWAAADASGLARDIKSLTREALVNAGYLPKEAAQVSVHFLSDERMQRDKNLRQGVKP